MNHAWIVGWHRTATRRALAPPLSVCRLSDAAAAAPLEPSAGRESVCVPIAACVISLGPPLAAAATSALPVVAAAVMSALAS